MSPILTILYLLGLKTTDKKHIFLTSFFKKRYIVYRRGDKLGKVYASVFTKVHIHTLKSKPRHSLSYFQNSII